MKKLYLSFLLCATISVYGQNSIPTITIQEVNLEDSGASISLDYILSDEENDDIQVRLIVLDIFGKQYDIDESSISGDIGFPFSSDEDLRMVLDISNIPADPQNLVLKVVADDLQEVDKQSIVDQITVETLQEYMTEIEGIRHFNTSPEHLANVRSYLKALFRDQNLVTYGQEFPSSGTVGENIIGFHAGIDATQPKIIVDAHYDTVSNSPGADDNGSGVAGMLMAMKVLSPYAYEHSLEFIGFDFEEVGLIGSLHYVNQITDPSSILGVYNLEMIGFVSDEPNSQELPTGIDLLFPDIFAEVAANEFRGDFITNITLSNFDDLANSFAEANERYVPEQTLYNLIVPPNVISLIPDLIRSDHAPFWGEDIPALFITDSANFRNQNYHEATDVVSTLNFEFMMQTVKTVVGSILELADVKHSSFAIASLGVATSNENIEFENCNFEANYRNQQINLFLAHCIQDVEEIYLVNTEGKSILLSKGTVEKEASFSVSNLVSGMYAIALRSKDYIYTQKLVITQ